MHFREAQLEDIPRILTLYKEVAAQPGGIARLGHEVTEAYVSGFVDKSIRQGLIIVCEDPENSERLVAELHAYRPGLSVFNHVFSDLTIAVQS